MPTNKTSYRFAIAAAASLAASSAFAATPRPTALSGFELASLSSGQTATGSSIACAAAKALPLVRSLRLGDLGGDGKADLLLSRTDGATRSTGRTWQYYPMDGTSKLSGSGTPSLERDLDRLVMGLGDFDGDGKTDVLTRHVLDGTWHLALMDGLTVRATGSGSASLSANLDWRVAGIADFDGDGKDDVLLRHSETGRWLQYKMNGRSSVASGSGIFAGLPEDRLWEVVGVGDLNGDGKGDLLMRHSADRTWAWYPLDGLSVAVGSGEVNLTTSASWHLAGLADLDGDGKDDILLRNTQGVWHWYPMDGRTHRQGNSGTDLSVELHWQLAGLGDLNGDGKDDVVLRDVSDNTTNQGRWMVRAMNGGNSIAAQSGIATQLSKVTAWDVAARDRAAGASCDTYAWSCPVGVSAPGTPSLPASLESKVPKHTLVTRTVDEMQYELLYTVSDSVSIPMSWSKPAGGKGNVARYLVDGEVALETSLGAVTGTGAQSGSATLAVSRGGKYDLAVAVCRGTCCTQSASRRVLVADTDGAHLEPLAWTPRGESVKGTVVNAGRASVNRSTAYPNPEGSMVAAYYVEWSGYQRNYDVHNIPAHNLTHILYGFIPVCSATHNSSLNAESRQALNRACTNRQDFKVAIHDAWGALHESRPGNVYNTPYKGNYGQLMELKQAYPEMVILPSVGGWTLSDPFYSFSNATYRKRFVDSLEEFLQVWKFYDGVDIDWEYPGGYGANRALGDVAIDRQTYTDLMRELRAMLDRMEVRTGRRYHLTSAVGAGSDKIARVDYRTVQQYMDQILLMTYDFYGAWDLNALGHMPGLFAPSWDPTDDYNGHSAVQAMLAQGVDPAKIVVGASMYGRGWRGVSPATAGQYLTGTSTGAYPAASAYPEGIWEPGTRDFWGIAIDERDARSATPTGDWTYHWDATAFSPYLYRSSDKAVISYDNRESVLAKGAYVRSKGLGGLFSWEIDGDDGTILNAMHDGLGHGTAVANRAPHANAGLDRTVNAGANAALDGSASFDPDGDRVTYAWALTSTGSSVTLSSASAERPTFTVPSVSANEDLVFTVTVSDGTLTATDTVTITVRSSASNTAPTAEAGADRTVQTTLASTTVTLDGSASADEDGDALDYAWTQTAGDSVTLVNASSALAEFTLAQVTATRTLTFELTVSDGLASATDTVTITVQPAGANRAPVITLATARTVTEGDAVTITATVSDPDGDTVSYAWNTGFLTGVSGTTTASISFTAPDVSATSEYTLTLTATDDDATPASASASIVVTVLEAPVAGVCRTTDPNAINYPAWVGGKDYVKFSRVAHQGLVWEAKWWTTKEPVITPTSWPTTWTLVSTAVEAAYAWHTVHAYSTGDEVNHGARRYRAGAWTQGDDPSAGGPWTDIGASTCSSNSAPSAEAGSDQSVTAGATVTLSGTGSDPDGDAITYSWSQKSGGTPVTLSDATSASPTFTAPSVTTSTDLVFTLTVSDDTLSASDTVTITVSPAGTLTANAGPDQSVKSGATVILAGAHTGSIPGTPIYTWWQDVTTIPPQITLTAPAVNPAPGKVQFTAPAVTTSTDLTFVLSVAIGSTSATDTVTVTVAPSNSAPSAEAGPDQSVASGASVTLSGSGSDSDGDTLSYSWSQDSGTTVTLSGAATATPTFTAPRVTASTDLVFTLTVSDETYTASDDVTVTVAANRAPSAEAGPSGSTNGRKTVTLNGSGTDADGDALTYAWSQTAGATVTLTAADTATPSFTAPASGAPLTFELTVSDGLASATDTVTISIIPAANNAPSVEAGSAQSVSAGATVTLSGSASDDDGDALTYAWTHSGGTPAVTLTGAASATATFTAPAVSASTDLTFTLSVSDSTDTSSDTVIITVTPSNSVPSAQAGADQSVSSGASVTLSGSGTDPDGDALTYAWSQDSGTTVTLSSTTTASTTFTAPTVTASTDLVFTLTVSDDTASGTDEVTVTVAPASTVNCTRQDPNASSYPAWDSAAGNYTGGDQVSHEGLAWQASQWTTQEPTITATDWPNHWTLLSPVEIQWHPDRIYLRDEEADRSTLRYRAKSWNQDKDPALDTKRQYWSASIGPATCP